jgi:CheY-like chemotaxis protein
MNIPSGPVMVVDDTPNILELLETTLRFKGYPVMTATNGQDALEKIALQRPALVITDILMPRMDGYSLAHTLRQNPKTRDIPIVFLSATYVSADDKTFGIGLGAVRFIEKPIDPDDFLLTVAEILTQGIPVLPAPMSDRDFYQGYRQRLEHKFRYKTTQIARIERLMLSLPPEQKPGFQSLLRQAEAERDEIQIELDQLRKITSELKPASGQ